MYTNHGRRPFIRAGAGMFATLFCAAAGAQAPFPSKPIRIVVPWVAGTPADIAARAVAERMAGELKQAVFIDNRPGAAGTVALPEVLRQPADGYTLYLLASASLIAPVLFPTATVDFSRDFEAVGQVEWSFNVLVTTPEKPFASVADLVGALQAKPDGMSFASGGNGSPPHLAGELFKQEAHVQVTHVPYAQISQAVTDLIGGRADYMFLGASLSLPLVKSGRLRALAVTSANRQPTLPDIPTMVESGYKGVVMRPFDGLLVRKGTPKDVVARLNESLQKAITTPAVRDSLASVGMEVAASTPDQFAKLVAVESERWQALARHARMKAD